jgi:hypothetical protein
MLSLNKYVTLALKVNLCCNEEKKMDGLQNVKGVKEFVGLAR